MLNNGYSLSVKQPPCAILQKQRNRTEIVSKNGAHCILHDITTRLLLLLSRENYNIQYTFLLITILIPVTLAIHILKVLYT